MIDGTPILSCIEFVTSTCFLYKISFESGIIVSLAKLISGAKEISSYTNIKWFQDESHTDMPIFL